MDDLNTNYLVKTDHQQIKDFFIINSFKQEITTAARTTLTSSIVIDVILTNNAFNIKNTTAIETCFSDL